MGFPLDRGSIEDGILTCHWHHARFDVASGCTFDLWADDVPTCAVELRADEVWVQPEFGCSDAAAYWRQRLEQGMAHNLGLVIAKAIQGQLAAGVSPIEIVRQAALFGACNRDGWGTGMTILTAIGNSLATLPAEETYSALFHGVRQVAIDCDDEAPARQRSSLSSRPSPTTLKRWLRRWVSVRHREAAERTVLTAIAIGAPPAVLADILTAAETDRVFADGGHALDFINKSFECLDLIGWQYAADLLPSVVGQMVAARGADEFGRNGASYEHIRNSVLPRRLGRRCRPLLARPCRRPYPVRPLSQILQAPRRPARALLRACAPRRRNFAHDLWPLLGLLHRPNREKATEPFSARHAGAFVWHRWLQSHM